MQAQLGLPRERDDLDGPGGRRSFVHCPTFGVVRRYQAASHSTERAIELPAFVIPGGSMVLPRLGSPGARPKRATS